MAETILLDIKIPADDITKAKSAIAAYRSEIKQLKGDQKNLTKQNKEGTDAFTDNAIALKKLSDELRVNERVLIANEKATEANTGSVDQMQKQLTVTTVAWKKLSKEERENTDTGKKLTKQKTELTAELKRVESATGDNTRNVGNYSEGMKEALTTTGLFSREQQTLVKAQKLFSVATNAATNSTKLFRIALISTGIGAIVVLLGALIASFLKTQKGMDKVTAVVRPMVAVFQSLKGLVQELGGSVFKGLAQILNGDIAEGFKTLGSGVTDAINNVGGAIDKGIEAGKKLDQLQKQIERSEINLTKTRAEQLKLVKEQNKIAEDVNQTVAVREAAARKALEADQELLKAEQAIIDLRIEKMKISQSLNDTNREDELELAALVAEREDKETQSLERATTLVNKLNIIRQQASAEELKALNEVQAAKDAAIEADIARTEENLTRQAEALAMEKAQKILSLKEALIEEQISIEEFNAEMLDIELENLELQKELAELFGESTIELDTKIADNKIANINRVKGAEKEGAEFATEVDGISKKQQIAAGKSALATTKGLLKDGSEAHKAVSSAETLINTYKAAQGAFSSLAGIPIVGPALGAIAAAVAVVSGLANVAKINSSNPSFAEGVIGVDGPGTGTSDSISANISRGESVMTAKVTSAYAPQLAAMERSVGNSPNFQLGNRNYAAGIINATASASAQSAQRDIDQRSSITNDLESTQIIVQVSDIERVQEEEAEALQVAVVQ